MSQSIIALIGRIILCIWVVPGIYKLLLRLDFITRIYYILHPLIQINAIFLDATLGRERLNSAACFKSSQQADDTHLMHK